MILPPPITRQEYENIELYLYGLRLLVNSDEFTYLKVEEIIGISEEIYYMTMAFSILSSYFEPTKAPRRSVVAWKARKYMPKKPPTNLDDIYHFTSAQVAAKALDIRAADVSRVTNGSRNTIHGYCFMYAEDYENMDPVVQPKRKYWWDY